jgi:hypothetical protein
MQARAAVATAGERAFGTFYTGMAIAALIVIVAGFSPTFFVGGLVGGRSFTPVVLAHGLIFSAWPLLFLLQAGLVATGRGDVHRRVGVAGALLAAAMVVSGALTAIAAARRGFSPAGGPPPLVFMAIPLADIAVFAGLVTAAIFLRKGSPMAHKRLMLLATIALLPPAFARLPFVGQLGPPGFFALTDVFFVACVLHDRRAHGRVHAAFKWGGAALVLSQPLRLGLAATAAWVGFAGWLVR